MQIIHFLGRILPEPAQITLPPRPSVLWKDPELGLSMEFSCHIKNSKIEVKCRVGGYREEYLLAIYMRALDLCRAQVDLVAFKMGWGLTVILDSFVNSNGECSHIFPQNNTLAALCTAFTLEKGFEQLCVKVIESPSLFFALRDLISAISLPHVFPVDCARAMDRLRHLIAEPGVKEAKAWQQFRQALQIDEAYLKFITDHSAKPRYGQPGHIPGEIATEVTRRAWVIMNRYFEYLKRECRPLPVTEFPMLTNI